MDQFKAQNIKECSCDNLCTTHYVRFPNDAFKLLEMLFFNNKMFFNKLLK